MAKIVKTIIRGLFKLIYGRVNFDNNINYSTEILKIDKYKNDIFPDKKYYIYLTNNCRIYTDLNENVAVIKDNIILDGHSYQQINGKLENIKNNSVFENGTPYFKKKINGTILNLLQGSSGENYFHFLCDILPKIWLATSKINLNKIDYFLINKKINWQINIFKMIGIPAKKILSAEENRHIEASTIISVTHPWYFKGYIQNEVAYLPIWIISELREKFIKNIKNNELKIFLDRGGSKFNHLKILNNVEVINFFKNKNYKVIKPENFSLDEQVEIFNNAKTVVAAHGAALTNIIFCSQKTNIIEIIPSSHPSKKCQRVSEILNLNYFRYTTEDTQHNLEFPYNINLNLIELEKIIDQY